MEEPSTQIDLTVTDLKQWSYCARIPFYRYVLPVDFARTYKMQRGKTAQAAVEALERRRRLKEYGLREGKRLFGISLRSRELGLAGKLDLLVVTGAACFPVEFKDTEGGVRKNHRVQIAAYAILAEAAFDMPAPEGFVYLVPTDEVVRVVVTAEERTRVHASLAEIRAMIADEMLPEPTTVRARCDACEYQNYCADIW